MANYINKGSDLVFPTLTDADGNVLLVLNGDTFTAPDGLVVDGIEIASTRTSRSTPAQAAVEAIVDPVVDAPAEGETV